MNFSISKFNLPVLVGITVLLTTGFAKQALAANTFGCEERMRSGSSTRETPALALSRVHAQIRFFGAHSKYSIADQALARTLDSQDPLKQIDLRPYGDALVESCVLAADNSELGPALVSMVGNTAFIKPGLGEIRLPLTATAVVIDLRDLPNTLNLKAALENVVSILLAAPAPGPTKRVRSQRGLADEGFSASNDYYRNEVVEVKQQVIASRGLRDLPIALVTDRAMAPQVAELAGSLRLANRVWIVGEDIFAGVAESKWLAVGDQGIAFRYADFVSNGKRWPDKVIADASISHLQSFARALPSMGIPTTRPSDTAEGMRPQIEEVKPFKDFQEPKPGKGDLRGALVISHGSLELFFNNFRTGGEKRLDDRLLEVLSTATKVDSSDRIAVRNILRRLGEAIHDGHNFVYDWKPASYPGAGLFPVLLDQVNDEVVVAFSLAKEVMAGDTILEIDGQSMESWLKSEFPRTAGATAGYRFDLAARELKVMLHERKLKLRGANGTIRDVVVSPYPVELAQKLMRPDLMRASGWLSDLGAPKIFYINLNVMVLNDVEVFKTLIGQAQGATKLVIDMRGYPGIDHNEVARRLIPYSFQTPRYTTISYVGPDHKTYFQEPQQTLGPAEGVYRGPIVLLVGPASVSAAEDFSMMLVDAKRVTVVGRQSAGTDGNMTGIQLPGRFVFTFTGMEVRHADGQFYNGIGIIPDKTVISSPWDLAHGVDRVLLEGIQ